VKVLVTGTQGYIGSLLGPYLAERGHEVLGVDAGFYRSAWLYSGPTLEVQTLRRDIRELTVDDLRGFDAVVHMAELSNDPLGQLAPHVTRTINHGGSVHLARTAKAAGVERFVYTSSCSVYGATDEDTVDEDSPLRPQTEYAKCKELVERDVGALADDSFSPAFLRNATVYGASPRLRFDVVLNNLCGLAWTTREIRMESDGTPWRPLVHVQDVCEAIAMTLEAPREAVHGLVLNVGDANANYQIREVAKIVADVFPGCEVTIGARGADQRSYRVAFDRIREALPEFRCDWDAERGARELLEVFDLVRLDSEDFRSRRFTRLKQIEYLLETGQIDDDFRWRLPGSRRPELVSA
jgi:nucleoside-diphosphate-sugar epimerase